MEEVIERNTYQHSKVKQWSDKIVEQVLSHLKDLNKPFKYIGEFLYCKYVTFSGFNYIDCYAFIQLMFYVQIKRIQYKNV